MTNFNFEDYYHDCKLFGGVYARNELPSHFRNKFYVVNLDRKEGDGTHWVVVFNCEKQCLYFDSFGVEPPEEVLHRMRRTGKQMVMNTYRIQEINSINCGLFCIYVIDQLLAGREFLRILTDFHPQEFIRNDLKINQLLK